MACIVAIPLAPYVGFGHAGFWSFVWRLVFAATLALVAVIVFCAGLSAILLSLDYLFDLPIRDEVHAHVWLIGLGFVGPAFALALILSTIPDMATRLSAEISSSRACSSSAISSRCLSSSFTRSSSMRMR